MKKIIFAFSLAALLVSMTGCLKDEKFLAVDETAPIVEFPIGGPGVVDNVYDVNDITKNIDTSIAINIASTQVLDRDVTVTVQVTPTIVTEFNTNHGTAYKSLPLANYSIENYTLTIPKGYRVGRLKIRLFFPKFNLDDTYALGLQIVNAPGLTISGNFNKFLWSFNLRNAYDGLYDKKSFFSHPVVATYGGFTNATGPYEVKMVTSGPTSVDSYIDGYAYPTEIVVNYLTPPTLAYFGGVNPRFTINPSNNTVTVASSPKTADPSVQAVITQTTADLASSKYYPTGISGYSTTKTIVAHFRWSVPADRVAKDTFVYTGPR